MIVRPRYQQGQLRTLQRHIAAWRAQYGPEREVIFPQIHEPGEAAQSDFTHMTSLGVTLGGLPFPHLVYHLVLVYSNIEAVQICFSESFESLVEGFERCIWQIGGVPRQHRTDHLGAAIHPLDTEERGKAKERYRLISRLILRSSSDEACPVAERKSAVTALALDSTHGQRRLPAR